MVMYIDSASIKRNYGSVYMYVVQEKGNDIV